jgi:hypothetical protein
VAVASADVTRPDGSVTKSDAVLQPWVDFRDQARKDRRRYEFQWMVNQNFTAGKQWLRYSPRDHRMFERKVDGRGRQLLTADTLGQHLATAVGKLSADDFRPNLLTYSDGPADEAYARDMNRAYGWGWEEEWQGDRKLFMVLRELVGGSGTAAVRCWFDRNQGPLLSDSFPHMAGRPILDQQAAARAVSASYAGEGPKVDFKPLREGKVVWEFLSGANLLPPPGVADAVEFPWELIVRPVYIPDLKARYGGKADGVSPVEVRAADYVGTDSRDPTDPDMSGGTSPSTAGKLGNHTLVYTGYRKPDGKFPQGETVVFTEDDVLLAHETRLPYNDAPYGPRSGVTYFRWEAIPNRFWGRAFIERGIDPQKTKNKRVTQIDEIIDRGMPKVFVEKGSLPEVYGDPVEIIEVEAGAPLPKNDGGIPVGPWMVQDAEMQDNLIEKALGLHDVSTGEAPPSATPYAALALRQDQDALKLEPVSKEFRAAVADLGRDTFEAMRQWGPQKRMLLVEDSDGDEQLEQITFDATRLPAGYKVRPAKNGALPRGQGAELQKVTDLYQAALQSGLVAQKPGEWLDWLQRSLDEGKALETPADDAASQARHKAALENVVMARTGQPVPVAPYDDPNLHVPEHREAQMALDGRAEQGDQQAALLSQVVEAHVQMHLAQAMVNQGQQRPSQPGRPQPPQQQGPQAQGPPGPPQGQQGPPGQQPAA